jgi:Ca2+:H+ antiporter
MQTSISLALGSGAASIGLTQAVVSAIARWTGTPLARRRGASDAVVHDGANSLVGTGRVSLLSGVVHLILLATWLFLVVVP